MAASTRARWIDTGDLLEESAFGLARDAGNTTIVSRRRASFCSQQCPQSRTPRAVRTGRLLARRRVCHEGAMSDRTTAQNTSIADRDALGQAEAVRRGDISPRELVDEAIRRIELLNPKLNAVIHEHFERA